MSVFADTKDTIRRFQKYIDEFIDLFTRNGLSIGRPKDILRFLSRLRENTFRDQVLHLGNSVLRREGYKIGLPVLFTIIAIAVGGIGIAGLGSAIGVPVAILGTVLASLGFTAGQEVDSAFARKSEYTSGLEIQSQGSAAFESVLTNAQLLLQLEETSTEMYARVKQLSEASEQVVAQQRHLIQLMTDFRKEHSSRHDQQIDRIGAEFVKIRRYTIYLVGSAVALLTLLNGSMILYTVHRLVQR